MPTEYWVCLYRPCSEEDGGKLVEEHRSGTDQRTADKQAFDWWAYGGLGWSGPFSIRVEAREVDA